MDAVLMDFGSCTEAREQICGQSEAQRLQDLAEERCSMTYRAPELFNVQSYCMIDERTDIWSLGCVLYAICFFKCPYDVIYEKGDSVALAVLNGNTDFPDSSPYTEVNANQPYHFWLGSDFTKNAHRCFPSHRICIIWFRSCYELIQWNGRMYIAFLKQLKVSLPNWKAEFNLPDVEISFVLAFQHSRCSQLFLYTVSWHLI